MNNKTIKIVFTPSGIRGEVAKGTDILTAARKLGADLDTVCGGNGLCGRCKIQLSEGTFPKYQITSSADHLSAPSAADRELYTDEKLAAGFRLGCKAKLLGDVIIDIPPESQVHQQVVRKSAADIEIEAKPAVELVVLEVAESQLDTPSGDLERLRDALEFETGYVGLEFDSSTLRRLQPCLREGNWKLTLAIYEKSRVIAIWAGVQKRAYGLAIDLGSTTIAGHLCDLENGKVVATAGLMNPQIRFGEDLMSRVSYSMMNPGGDLEMTDAVRKGINQMVDTLLTEANVDRDVLLDTGRCPVCAGHTGFAKFAGA